MNAVPPPQEQNPASVAGSALIVATFGLLAVVLVGLSLYYLVEVKEPVSSPRVWVAALGAVYLGIRAWMVFAKNRARNAR